jgi:hypothetical protein
MQGPIKAKITLFGSIGRIGRAAQKNRAENPVQQLLKP